MIDFTNLPVRNKTYAGANGSKISVLYDETLFISDLQKKFYKTMLRERKERILDFSYQKLRKRERSKGQER